MSNVKCNICYEFFNQEDKVSTIRCGHVFHESCILRWILRNSSCPQCRQMCTWLDVSRLFLNFSSLDDSDKRKPVLKPHEVNPEKSCMPLYQIQIWPANKVEINFDALPETQTSEAASNVLPATARSLAKIAKDTLPSANKHRIAISTSIEKGAGAKKSTGNVLAATRTADLSKKPMDRYKKPVGPQTLFSKKAGGLGSSSSSNGAVRKEFTFTCSNAKFTEKSTENPLKRVAVEKKHLTNGITTGALRKPAGKIGLNSATGAIPKILVSQTKSPLKNKTSTTLLSTIEKTGKPKIKIPIGYNKSPLKNKASAALPSNSSTGVVRKMIGTKTASQTGAIPKQPIESRKVLNPKASSLKVKTPTRPKTTTNFNQKFSLKSPKTFRK